MHTQKCLVALTVLFTYINTTLALDGLGTQASPWLIKSITDFDQFTANPDYWDDYTRLETDIDLTAKYYTKAPIAPNPDPAPDPSTITTRPGEGLNGSDRITIIWPDNTIEKQWLEVTVKATDQTGLPQDDTFYFGNAPGDTGDNPTDANVNALDVSAIRDNPRNIFNPAPIDNPHDINRDHNVNVLDCSVVRDNATNIFTALKLIVTVHRNKG